MGIKDWLLKHELQHLLQRAGQWLQGWRDRTRREDVQMSGYLKLAVAAFLGGLVAAFSQAISQGGFSFTLDWLSHAAVGIVAGGLTALVAYLKESPLPLK